MSLHRNAPFFERKKKNFRYLMFECQTFFFFYRLYFNIIVKMVKKLDYTKVNIQDALMCKAGPGGDLSTMHFEVQYE